MENKLIPIDRTNNSIVAATPEEIATLRLENQHLKYGYQPRRERLKFLEDELALCAMIKHEEIDDTMIPLEAQVLDDYLIDSQETRDLIPQELDYCFRMGIAGKFGQYYGLTPVSLYGFVQSYLRTRKKFEASFQERVMSKDRTKPDRPIEISPVNNPVNKLSFNPNMVNDVIESDDEHRMRVRMQAQQIYKEYGIK